jgi:hypothetical protein
MTGCIAFAGLSAYLAVGAFGVGFDAYTNRIHCNFTTAQRDVLFRIIPELRPPLQAEQIVAAANAANVSIEQRTARSIVLIGGVEFGLAGPTISSIRSNNF